MDKKTEMHKIMKRLLCPDSDIEFEYNNGQERISGTYESDVFMYEFFKESHEKTGHKEAINMYFKALGSLKLTKEQFNSIYVDKVWLKMS